MIIRKEIIGNCELYLGDCLEVMPLIGNVDFVYADPPYGIGKAEWDNEYFTGWENTAVEISRNGVVANVGEKALAKAIMAFGNSYKGLFYAWNVNGMTFTSIGFQNIMPAICAGKVGGGGQNFCRFKISKEKEDHPSPKPIGYMKCVITRFTKEDYIVLDPFMGSGTTGVACVELGRRFVGIEINEKYFDIACKRIELAAAQGLLNF
jgi:DNA modification methylase